MTISNKIACIGAGYWGQNLVRNFNGLGVLSWVCDADPHRRAQLAIEYPDARLTDAVDQVLSDPDVAGVAIATPAVTHADLVRRALLAGKDVFVEKPLSLSVEEAQRLVALASDRRLILMVGHLLWYHPAVLKLKQLVDEQREREERRKAREAGVVQMLDMRKVTPEKVMPDRGRAAISA